MDKLACHGTTHGAPVPHVRFPGHVLDDVGALLADTHVPAWQADSILRSRVANDAVTLLLQAIKSISFTASCRGAVVLIVVDLVNFELVQLIICLSIWCFFILLARAQAVELPGNLNSRGTVGVWT